MDAIDSPAYGPMAFDGRDHPEQLDGLTAEFEDAIEEDVERGFY